jgi:phosphoserine phosphatase
MTEHSKKNNSRLIVFDIDGTLTRHVSSWQFIHERLGIWNNEAERYQEQFLAGKITYRKFCRLDAAHWKGIPEKTMLDLFKEIPLARNATRALSLLRENGFILAALSTGIQFIVDRVKKELGLDYAAGNTLKVKRGRLTGNVEIKIDHLGKGKALRSVAKRYKTNPSDVIVVGDSHGDLPMMRAAGYAIAFNPNSRDVCDAADYCCRSEDFMEVCNQIFKIRPNSPTGPEKLKYNG